MKRVLSILLGLALLCGAAMVAAEAELPYLETEELPDNYFSGTMLTKESVPQICISPYYDGYLFESTRKEPWYVMIPIPEGANCRELGIQSCNILDAENHRQIIYEAMEKFTVEKFLEKCDDEAYIVLDGSDGTAAYVSPKGAKAYALLPLDEIQEGTKLRVVIYLNNITKKDDGEKVTLLKEAILAEIERIRENITCAVSDTFWTDGTCRGVKLLSEEVPGMTLTMDMPEVSFHFTDGGFTGKFFPTDVYEDRFVCYAVKNRERDVKIEVKVAEHSAVYSKEENEVTTVTLSDGCEWGIYVANEKDGQPYAFYAAKKLSDTNRRGEEKPVYLTIYLDPSSGQYWTDLDAAVADLDVLAQNIHTQMKDAQ